VYLSAVVLEVPTNDNTPPKHLSWLHPEKVGRILRWPASYFILVPCPGSDLEETPHSKFLFKKQ
jgi:hypothetical protein